MHEDNNSAIEKLMIGMEKLAKEPVIISLFIKKGKIYFIDCTVFNKPNTEEHDESEPEYTFTDLNKSNNMKNIPKYYIG